MGKGTSCEASGFGCIQDDEFRSICKEAFDMACLHFVDYYCTMHTILYAVNMKTSRLSTIFMTDICYLPNLECQDA